MFGEIRFKKGDTVQGKRGLEAYHSLRATSNREPVSDG
jgi:hypothetical protein